MDAHTHINTHTHTSIQIYTLKLTLTNTIMNIRKKGFQNHIDLMVCKVCYSMYTQLCEIISVNSSKCEKEYNDIEVAYLTKNL